MVVPAAACETKSDTIVPALEYWEKGVDGGALIVIIVLEPDGINVGRENATTSPSAATSETVRTGALDGTIYVALVATDETSTRHILGRQARVIGNSSCAGVTRFS